MAKAPPQWSPGRRMGEGPETVAPSVAPSRCAYLRLVAVCLGVW